MKKIIFSLMLILSSVLGYSQNSNSQKDYSTLILGKWLLKEAAGNAVDKGFAMYGAEYYGTSFFNKDGTGSHISLYKTSWKIDNNILIEKMIENDGYAVKEDIWIKYKILTLNEETLEVEVAERHGDTGSRIDWAPRLKYKRK